MKLFLLHVFCISSCLLPESLGASSDDKRTAALQRFEPLKDTCPEACIPGKECDDADSVSEIRSYVPLGNGFCNFVTGLDQKHCPIPTDHECMMKCGGEICSTRPNIDKYGKEWAKFIKVYQRFGEPTLTYARYRKVEDKLEEQRRIKKMEKITGEEKVQEVIEKVDKE